MNKKQELEDLKMLFRTIVSDEGIIEKGQKELCEKQMMALNMTPNRIEWEKLGFKFHEIKGDNVLCAATMPNGWNIKSTGHPMHSDIVDNNGIIRGNIFYKTSLNDRIASMDLKNRYKICSEYLLGSDVKTVYFGNKDEKLFIAGQIEIGLYSDYENRFRIIKKLKELEYKALEYATLNYPEWKDFNAYWDKANTKVKKGGTII